MKIEEVLHLFTRVEDEIPESTQWVLCIIFVSNFMELKHLLYEKGTGFKCKNKVGYWLDLSKLTTKEELDKKVKEAWESGFSNGLH